MLILYLKVVEIVFLSCILTEKYTSLNNLTYSRVYMQNYLTDLHIFSDKLF